MPKTVCDSETSQGSKASDSGQRNRRVLVIDDNKAIHEDFRKVLTNRSQTKKLASHEESLFGKKLGEPESLAFELDSAYQGPEGLEWVKKSLEENRPYAMAFVDIRMPPSWDGVETVRRIWEVDQRIQICLCTAYSDFTVEEILAKLETRDRLLFLKKPFDNSEVRLVARALTEKWHRLNQVDKTVSDLGHRVNEQTSALERARKALQRDAEARRRAEKRELALGKILDETLTELYLLDSDSLRLVHANRGARKNLGYSAKEISNLGFFELSPTLDRDALEELLEPLRKGKNPICRYHDEFRRKDGTIYPVEIQLQTGSFEDREVIVGFATDITDRRLAEQERVELEEQLRQSQKMEAIGQLAGGVAHDFNNMLQVISGFVEMARERLPDEEPSQDYLGEIAQAADRATRLTQQLLAYSRRQILFRRELDLNELVAGLLEMLRRLIGEHIEVAFEPGTKVGCVKADAGQLEQCVVNLSLNARDAMPDGGRLVLKTESVLVDEALSKSKNWQQSGPFAKLTVSDSGCGIPTDIQSKVFDPFFTTKGIGKGTGLGLSMVHGIINQHNGMIDVSSEPGNGTTFEIYLPRLFSESKPEPKPDYIVPDYGGRECILFAEDEPQVRRFAAAALRSAGYEVLLAGDGQEAVELYSRHSGRINLVVMDVMMPKMNGMAARDEILKQNPGTRFLMVSGYSLEDLDESLQSDNLLLLHKPFEFRVLCARVRELLDASAETED